MLRTAPEFHAVVALVEDEAVLGVGEVVRAGEGAVRVRAASRPTAALEVAAALGVALQEALARVLGVARGGAA